MKKTDQILKNGHLCQDYDQTLSTKGIDDLFKQLFGKHVVKDGKQQVLFNKIGVLTANVTYLGHPHPIYKKRIQLKDYFLQYYENNLTLGKKTIYVGIYSYNKTRLFVVFEPKTYAGKKSHNSSAHIYSMNLQYAQITGEFSKIDAFGNSIHVFKENHFVKYVNNLAGIENDVPDYDFILNVIKEYLESFFLQLPREWNGLFAYKEMIKSGFKNARQNRWPGWYFEYLLQDYLSHNHTTEIAWNADKTKNGIDLDLVFPSKPWTYGDIKADQENEDVLGNNFESFENVVVRHGGVVYYICVFYKAEKDSDHDYVVSKFWNSLRDADKAYSDFETLKERAGKAMKYSVKLKTVDVLKIDRNIYEILKENPFHQGVNSDGKARAPKLKIKKEMISALSIYTKNFEENMSL